MNGIQLTMASMSDEVYRAPGLNIYTKNGCLIAEFGKHTNIRTRYCGSKQEEHL